MKPYGEGDLKIGVPVAPLVGAWIETIIGRTGLTQTMSLPSWERGLKPLTEPEQSALNAVAPLVGAWIETVNTKASCSTVATSLPSWERGLKHSRYGSYHQC